MKFQVPRFRSQNSVETSNLKPETSILDDLGGLPAEFTAQTLPGGGLFGSLLLTRFQIKGMLLDFLDDVFLLDFAFKSLQRRFQGFTFLNNYFCQLKLTSFL